MKIINWLVDKTGLKVWAIVALLALLVALLTGAGVLAMKISGWRADSAALKDLRGAVAKYQADEAKSKQLAALYEEALAKTRAANQKLNERLNDAIQKANLGTDDTCRWPTDWLPAVNQALSGKP